MQHHTIPGWIVEIRQANGSARQMVETALHRAVLTLHALPDPDLRYFQIGSTWPTYARRYLDAYNPDEEINMAWQPTPHDVTVYLDVLGWTRGLTPAQWRVCVHTAEGCSPQMVGDYMRMPTGAVVQLYDQALDVVAAAALAAVPAG